MGNLDGRVAIVTGGARGIGRAYCLGLAKEGAAVVVADLGDAGRVVEEITSDGGRAVDVQVDVAERASVMAMAETATNRLGDVDILVNNAGYMTNARQSAFEDIPDEEWERPFAVNVRGSWLCACAVAPTMKRRRSGRIINISSMTVADGTPTLLHYLSSKAAIIGLTRGLARELGPFNVAVNTVTPDYIPHDKDFVSRQPDHQGEWIASRRCFAREETPEDMVGAVVFLSGSGADFITGQNIVVNGGSAFF